MARPGSSSILPAMLHHLALALALAAVAVPHPHYPKAIKLHGAAGMLTVTYFTVDFNQVRLDEAKPGFDWHLGYAELATAVDLACGDVTVAKGAYKLNTRRGEGADTWSAVLVPKRLWTAQIANRRAARAGEAAVEEAKAALEVVEAELKTAGVPAEIVLPLAPFTAAEAEHLTLMGVHYGYATVERGSEQPAGGMECGVKISFGGLHRELKLVEAFAAADKDK